jgi:hypothetical protein
MCCARHACLTAADISIFFQASVPIVRKDPHMLTERVPRCPTFPHITHPHTHSQHPPPPTHTHTTSLLTVGAQQCVPQHASRTVAQWPTSPPMPPPPPKTHMHTYTPLPQRTFPTTLTVGAQQSVLSHQLLGQHWALLEVIHGEAHVLQEGLDGGISGPVCGDGGGGGRGPG